MTEAEIIKEFESCKNLTELNMTRNRLRAQGVDIMLLNKLTTGFRSKIISKKASFNIIKKTMYNIPTSKDMISTLFFEVSSIDGAHITIRKKDLGDGFMREVINLG